MSGRGASSPSDSQKPTKNGQETSSDGRRASRPPALYRVYDKADLRKEERRRRSPEAVKEKWKEKKGSKNMSGRLSHEWTRAAKHDVKTFSDLTIISSQTPEYPSPPADPPDPSDNPPRPGVQSEYTGVSGGTSRELPSRRLSGRIHRGGMFTTRFGRRSTLRRVNCTVDVALISRWLRCI